MGAFFHVIVWGNNYPVLYDRVGRVFQGRHKAILCNNEAYLLEITRYIHLNPPAFQRKRKKPLATKVEETRASFEAEV